MVSFFLVFLVVLLAVGIETQGRKRQGKSLSKWTEVLGALVSRQAPPALRARLFCLAISLLFAIWEAMVWFLFESERGAFAALRLFGFALLVLFIGLRYRAYFWQGEQAADSSLTVRSVMLFYWGFCLSIFAPLSAVVLGLWIAFRWRQKFVVSQIDQDTSP